MIKINKSEIYIGKFPIGEVNINKKEITQIVTKEYGCCEPEEIVVEFKYESDSDFIHLMFIKAEIDRLYPRIPKGLYIRYMPYSRMDRKNDVYIFTLKYITTFINNLKFDAITVEEPHSDVCLALLNNCTAVYTTKTRLTTILKTCKFDKQKDSLFFPDAGAQKRYSNLKGFKTLVGYKERDIETGRIEKYNIFGKLEEGSKIIIMDDLCSKGGTFILAAKKLKELGAGDIYLFVGHVEQTVFEGEILNTDLIKLVITSDSIKRTSHSKILTIERSV